MPNQYIKTTTNQNIFSIIDTEEKAYWLGFLYADGCVRSKKGDYQIELSLQEQDYEHLKKFRKFIGNNNKIAYREKQKAYRYCFRSKQIHSDLIKQGCVPCKSLILKFPTEEQVPNEYIKDFIRGYFDGDGCLYKKTSFYAIEILGTEEFLNGLKNRYPLLNYCTNYLNNYHKPDGVRKISTNKRSVVVQFLQDIYGNASIYLDRKYKKYIATL